MKRIVISWIVCVLGLVGLLAWLGGSLMPKSHETTTPASPINGAFTLQGEKGKTVTDKDFRGRYMLIYFGFTHCPDLCPTTLLLMQNAIHQLGNAGANVQPIFITIDPERDTPDIAAAYAKHFGEHMIGLSGSPAQIKQAADHYKIYYSKVEDNRSALGYMMDHSGFIYLMGPDGKYLAHFPHTTSEQALQEGLSRYVK